MKKKHFIIAIILLLIAVSIPDLLKWNYWLKSAIKVTFLLIIPLVYIKYKKDKLALFKIDKKLIIIISLLSLGIFIFIVGGYFLLKDIVDFSSIAGNLENIGVRKDNFIYVALYIALINSFIEEFFFRGFIINYLGKQKKTAIIISASLFSLYHLLIIQGWSSPLIIFLTLGGLFLVGLFFNYLACKFQTILVTYLPHMSANLSINYIGLFLLGILTSNFAV